MIDVLISTFNEERYVERCLHAVISQTHPAEAVRVWLIDGGSTDRTVEIARAHARRAPRLRVLADGRRLNLPEALNEAMRCGQGELVAKVDAHGYPSSDFLARAVAALADGGSEVACVGGRPVQMGETRFGGALAQARQSRFGVGGSEYAGTTARSVVDTVQCGVYRRAALESVGGFDPTMAHGEDEEVNWRLRKAGHRIVLDDRIRFTYVTRPDWPSAYRQYRNYGRARVRVVRRHPGFLRAHHLVPGAAVATGLGLMLASPFSRIARRTFGGLCLAYGAVGAAAALVANRRPSEAALVAAAFPALHGGYGVGMLLGIADLARTTGEARRSGATSGEEGDERTLQSG